MSQNNKNLSNAFVTHTKGYSLYRYAQLKFYKTPSRVYSNHDFTKNIFTIMGAVRLQPCYEQYCLLHGREQSGFSQASLML